MLNGQHHERSIKIASTYRISTQKKSHLPLLFSCFASWCP
ncbi:hypothetical protein T4A_2004 [Trichinella pseudospiralis]|uniref:Uncharacterized protein n=1 Tax=Trichinella pseudospiralis TaxID=6337 RepID=A0A0V1DJX0_TRIPS|nr:hypothetical protein T4A_2004 [Trichinella pseudospiralis]